MGKRRTHSKSKDRSHKHAGPGGARPFWAGTISFGLVSVPVYLFPATRRTRAGLRMMDNQGTPLARRFYCPAHGKEVHPEHIVRGYPVAEGEYVIVTEEELESLQPQKSREIDLVQFVSSSEIPPLLVERTYFLTPAGETNKAYRLLAAVMEKTDRAGLATFVMRDREYLVAILASDGILRAHTMRFADEIRWPDDLGLPAPTKPQSNQRESMAEQIARLSRNPVDANGVTDEYQDRLTKLVRSKQKRGEDMVQVDDEAATAVDEGDEEPELDLLETIRRNLAGDSLAKQTDGHRGNGRAVLEDTPKEALYERAASLEIAGRSKMTKAELIRAIRRRER